MEIQLDAHWRIRRYDSQNFVIEEYREGGVQPITGVQGKSKWHICGFYSRLSSAIKALPVHVPYDMTLRSFEAVTDRLETMADSIEAQV